MKIELRFLYVTGAQTCGFRARNAVAESEELRTSFDLSLIVIEELTWRVG